MNSIINKIFIYQKFISIFQGRNYNSFIINFNIIKYQNFNYLSKNFFNGFI